MRNEAVHFSSTDAFVPAQNDEQTIPYHNSHERKRRADLGGMMGVLNKTMRIFLLTFVVFSIFALPVAVTAQGLVPCGGAGQPECQACHLVILADTIIDFLITISAAIGAILFALAGLKMATSGGNETAVSDAKKSMTNIVIGFIILLAAWLIVDTIMKTFAVGDSRFGTWNKIQCVDLPRYAEIAQESPDEVGATEYDTATPSPTTGNLVTYAGYQFDSGVVDKMQYIADTYGLRVSGGYRTPERNAEVKGSPTSHHLTGRAGDFVGSSAQMNSAASWARSNGAREVLIHNAGSGLHLHVAF